MNADNDIIVSDFHNHQVKVYDAEGTFKFAFGSNGEGNGQFKVRPDRCRCRLQGKHPGGGLGKLQNTGLYQVNATQIMLND